MCDTTLTRRAAPALITLAAALALAAPGWTQPPPPARAPADAKALAPEDLTGYWVSIVTEDWRWRMVTPPKGDYASVPLNPEGRRVADTWDPAKDEASGNQCKSYGAPAIMRVPGRLHITWDNENTLKIDTDAGEQTRLFHFGAAQPPSGAPTWQGYSVADWEFAGPPPRGGRGGPNPKLGGSLKVETSHIRPGYLRKNGVPYSDKATVTEYYTRTNETNGDSWLIVTTIVNDPVYLAQPFVTSTHFKKEPDGSKWSPSRCTAR
ncbi:MAG TPA: hypothetical protein VJ732_06330 [Bryobacteraceae bacterium]|nr:hypothetical protein [Bryobacteraceae bacterium]